jgi:DNA-binding NtrC family response regulator
VNQGSFRADLYYRQAVAEVRMPALREHAEDIPELVDEFVRQLPGAPNLPPLVLRELYEREYPGNVRELRNAVERAVLGLAPEPASRAGPGAAEDSVELDVPFLIQKDRVAARFEARYFRQLMDACGGNISEAARRSGLSRVHLYKLLRRRGVQR